MNRWHQASVLLLCAAVLSAVLPALGRFGTSEYLLYMSAKGSLFPVEVMWQHRHVFWRISCACLVAFCVCRAVEKLTRKK